MTWHILDVRATWIGEFTAALGQQVDTLGWMPDLRRWCVTGSGVRQARSEDPPFPICHFSLVRGFARPLVANVLRPGRAMAKMVRAHGDASTDVLVCTAPHYEAVARNHSGPVVYYVTDSFVGYGEPPARIARLEHSMCSRADLVCPNSHRIAEYLVREAGCDERKVVVIPNATRAANVPREPLVSPSAPPGDTADVPRPVAGVIGNLAANMDWVLLSQIMEQTPWLAWVFVGPTQMPVPDSDQRSAREQIMRSARAKFVGLKPYGDLQRYARSFDVAVLPYRKIEPGYSGSATRFYEHLAACRPILATDGVAELLTKEPLLRIFRTAAEAAAFLNDLRQADFRDGLEELRWRTSRAETWSDRATKMRDGLTEVRSLAAVV